MKLQEITKVAYTIGVLIISAISLWFAWQCTNFQSYLAIFWLIPIVLNKIFEIVEQQCGETIFLHIASWLAALILPAEAILIYHFHSIKIFFVEADKIVFFFLYYKKVQLPFFMFLFIISLQIGGKYIKHKIFNTLIPFLISILIIFIYNIL
jgi:hypothetical protein